MTREENITFLQISISYFVDLIIYNIEDDEIVKIITENRKRIVKELTDSFLSNKNLMYQFKRELSNIEFNIKEVRKAENEN